MWPGLHTFKCLTSTNTRTWLKSAAWRCTVHCSSQSITLSPHVCIVPWTHWQTQTGPLVSKDVGPKNGSIKDQFWQNNRIENRVNESEQIFLYKTFICLMFNTDFLPLKLKNPGIYVEAQDVSLSPHLSPPPPLPPHPPLPSPPHFSINLSVSTTSPHPSQPRNLRSQIGLICLNVGCRWSFFCWGRCG